ncbi:MAG: hypothetical protein R2706_00480 [Acidimicrobiales bacterium]
MTEFDSFDTDSGDELQSQLHDLADALPVGPSAGLAPQARHAQRVKRGRIGAATLAAFAIGAVAVTATQGGPGDAGVVIAAADQIASAAVESTDPISFSQRTVDGLVSYPSCSRPNGRRHALRAVDLRWHSVAHRGRDRRRT